jgi:hypothetical protein
MLTHDGVRSVALGPGEPLGGAIRRSSIGYSPFPLLPSVAQILLKGCISDTNVARG